MRFSERALRNGRKERFYELLGYREEVFLGIEGIRRLHMPAGYGENPAVCSSHQGSPTATL